MAESTTSTSQTEASPLTGPSSFGSVGDAQGLPAIKETPQYRNSHELNSSNRRLVLMRNPSAGSCHASLGSSVERSHNEKSIEDLHLKTRYVAPANAAREAWQKSERAPVPGADDQTGNMRDDAKQSVQEKRGGLRNTIRRIFRRRSAKDRISLPNSTVYPRHNPGEFITSATGVDVKKERSVSVPNPGLFRTSGLASHPPSQNQTEHITTHPPPVPIHSDYRVPERPPRPRRASVPSILLNLDEVQTVSNAVAASGNEQDPEAVNIGFAVTNGSNPRRRSRSVGTIQANHRMSPIQWRNIRRRSDDIKFWRESADVRSSHAFQNSWSPQLSPKLAHNYQETAVEGAEQDQSANFNFGLPPDNIQGHERMGLEERLVTLELKLMDIEYSVSKFQAGSTLASRPHSHTEGRRRRSGESSVSSEILRVPAEASQPPVHGASPNLPQNFPSEADPKDRPTSVATTMKAGPSAPYNSHGKGSVEFSNRSSLTGLTVEHYTTLVSLIRNERSARMQLEEHVTQLQKQVDQLSQPRSWHSHHPSISHSHSRSQQSHTLSQSSQQRRHGIVDPGNRGAGFYKQERRRSSSYSTNETDTDDDVFYVTPEITPIERGEYERGAFERVCGVAEGAAF